MQVELEFERCRKVCSASAVFWPLPPAELDASQRRWGLQAGGRGNWARWHLHDERFDLRRHPNEFHRFGWVVEIDPHDPTMTPVKRTALGRAVHEGAATGVSKDGRAVVFMGEDARFELLVSDARDRSPQVNEHGFIDFRELGEIPVVTADQPLMRRIPATPGQLGCNVRGESIEPQPNKSRLRPKPTPTPEPSHDRKNHFRRRHCRATTKTIQTRH